MGPVAQDEQDTKVIGNGQAGKGLVVGCADEVTTTIEIILISHL